MLKIPRHHTRQKDIQGLTSYIGKTSLITLIDDPTL